MREMSEADKVWFRNEFRSTVRQVLHEEFGEAMQFLRSVQEKADMDALAGMVTSGDEETKDGKEC